jgi:hypothetical protein
MGFYYASLGKYLWKTTYLWMDLHRDRDDHPVGVNCCQPGNSGIQIELGARGKKQPDGKRLGWKQLQGDYSVNK